MSGIEKFYVAGVVSVSLRYTSCHHKQWSTRVAPSPHAVVTHSSVDRVSSCQDTAPGVKPGVYPCLCYGDTPLLHNLVNGSAINVTHLGGREREEEDVRTILNGVEASQLAQTREREQ